MFDATFVPMLLYGMETASLTENEELRLEASYRNLLQLYRIPSTCYTKVLEPETPTASNDEIDPDRTVIYTLRASKVKLLISTLQLPHSSILRNVCFKEAVTFRQLQGQNRRGRPRRHWLKTASEDCWRGLATDIMGPGGGGT